MATFAKAFGRPSKSDPMTVPEAERILKMADKTSTAYRCTVAFLEKHAALVKAEDRAEESERLGCNARIQYAIDLNNLKADHKAEVYAIDLQHLKDMDETKTELCHQYEEELAGERERSDRLVQDGARFRKRFAWATIIAGIGWLAALVLAIVLLTR